MSAEDEYYQNLWDKVRRQSDEMGLHAQRALDLDQSILRSLETIFFQTFLSLPNETLVDDTFQPIHDIFAMFGWQRSQPILEGAKSYVPTIQEAIDEMTQFHQVRFSKNLYTIALGALVEGGTFVGESTSHLPLADNQTYLFLRPKGYDHVTSGPAIGLLLENFPKEGGRILQLDFIPSVPPAHLLPKS